MTVNYVLEDLLSLISHGLKHDKQFLATETQRRNIYYIIYLYKSAFMVQKKNTETFNIIILCDGFYTCSTNLQFNTYPQSTHIYSIFPVIPRILQ